MGIADFRVKPAGSPRTATHSLVSWPLLGFGLCSGCDSAQDPQNPPPRRPERPLSRLPATASRGRTLEHVRRHSISGGEVRARSRDGVPHHLRLDRSRVGRRRSRAGPARAHRTGVLLRPAADPPPSDGTDGSSWPEAGKPFVLMNLQTGTPLAFMPDARPSSFTPSESRPR